MKLKTKRMLLYLNIILSLMSVIVITCNNVEQSQITFNTQKQINSLQATDEQFKDQSAKYHEINASLKEKLAENRLQLQAEQNKISVLKQTLTQKLNENWNVLPVEIHLEKCDSLKLIVKQYEDQRTRTDSLTQVRLCTME